MDTIEGMRTFVAVASQCSFTGGAKQLGVSTKLASKYVRQLEEHLGAQLFHRTTRSVSLTETGQAYLERCIPLLDQFDELESVVQERQSELAGPIRITAPTGFGSHELVQALYPFQQQHPKVTIDLQLSDHVVSVVEGGFDLAIRFGALEDSALIARKLLDMRMVVFASPEYLSTNGIPIHPSELVQHNCLLQKTSIDPENWRFRIDNEITSYRVHGSFKANSPRAVAQMARDGLGIGLCPYYTVAPFLKEGELSILFEEYEATVLGLYAVYPPSRHLTARIRALIDHLVDTLGDNLPWSPINN
jgi:DNA-binding transcriptional LysR family regulator